jgi:isochorismate hydrolase
MYSTLLSDKYMNPNSENEINEEYVTNENINSKTQVWLDELKYHMKGRLEFKVRNSVLLVIDMQRFFLDEDSHAYIPASKAILPNVQNLIESYHKARLPVIFTQHALLEEEDPGIMGRWWKDVLREEDPKSELHSSILPSDKDIVIRKTKYNAFMGTQLEDFLEIKLASSVVICGVMTDLCCETTAREAFSRDYEVYFLADATATITEDLHLSSLRTLAHGFAEIITTQDILSAIGGR